MKRTFLIAAGVAVAAAAVSLWGVGQWRDRVVASRLEASANEVARLMEHGKWREARRLLDATMAQNRSSLPTARQEEWIRKDVVIATELGDLRRLAALHRRAPETTASEEKSALLLARLHGMEGETETAHSLRDRWRGKETLDAAWLGLDADRLARAGQRGEAVALLESVKLDGTDDCSRLMRLALLHVDDPAKAVAYLDQAYEADPANADLRSLRGQILESQGEWRRARVEYVAAMVADPDNPLPRVQLADFHLRLQDYPRALDTLAPDAPVQQPTPALAWKRYFWERVTLGTTSPAALNMVGETVGEPIREFLAALPDNAFWNGEHFAKLPQARRLTEGTPEIRWLQTLEAARNGDDEAVLRHALSTPALDATFPASLRAALVATANFRLHEIPPQPGAFPSTPYDANRHSYFDRLDAWSQSGDGTMPEALRIFLKSSEAYAGAVLAAGWTGAALDLAKSLQTMESPPPEWFVYGVTRAIWQTQGAGQAEEWLGAHPVRPASALELLVAEIKLASGDGKTGQSMLAGISKNATDTGARAAWILAAWLAEQGDLNQAIQTLKQHPELRQTRHGGELLAGLLVQSGRENEAQPIYEALAQTSEAAMVYLARQSLRNGDEAKAIALLESLVQKFPDTPEYYADLARLRKRQQNPDSTSP